VPTLTHQEVVSAPEAWLFDLTQDYSRRLAWDPFPEAYEFHPPAHGPSTGAEVTVSAKNGYTMRVRYVSFNPPRAAAIEMVRGPWFISKFSGTWRFVAQSRDETMVWFKYNVVAAPPALRFIIEPLVLWAFSSHAKRRLKALKSYAERAYRADAA
jgi:ribosome-associated toxin RatA of RatAB toxin-antitoxin module